jgi:RNA ligase
MMNLLGLIREFDIPVIETHGCFESATDLLEFTRPLVGVEGFVVAFPDGHRVKVKAEQYLRIHKVKDLIRTERHIASLILNEELDDVLPILDVEDVATVREYEHQLHISIQVVLSRIEGLVTLARVLHGNDRKAVALNFIPNLRFKEDARFIFGVLDGRDTREEVLKKIKVDIGNTEKYNTMKRWMEW